MVGWLSMGASVASFVGFTLSGSPYLVYLGFIFLTIVFGIILYSIPKLPEAEDVIANRDDNLSEINDFLHRYPILALVGAMDCGKTTFLSNVLNRRNPKRNTRLPYFRRLKVGQGASTREVIVIDSVGESKEAQFDNHAKAHVSLFIFDHTKGSTGERVVKRRLADHRTLATELIDSRRRREQGADTVLLIPNKVDLRTDSGVEAEFAEFAEEMRQQFVDSQVFDRVELLCEVSLESSDGAVEVLQKLGDLL